MEEPICAGNEPVGVTLGKGEHFWCVCGRSSNQPFCDGSHAGSSFQPLAFGLDKEQEVFLCMCKRTKNPPFCDGTHSTL